MRRISIVRLCLACLLLIVAAAARADTTPGAPSSRPDPTLHPFDGPFAAALSGDALRRLRCVPAFMEAFPDFADGKEVAARLHCRRLPLAITVAGTPFLEAEVWEGHARFNWDKQVEVLAVRTPRGWWVAPFAYFWQNRWNAVDGSHLTAEGIAAAADPPALVVRWRETYDDWTWDVHRPPADDHTNDEGRTVTMHDLAVVGVGPSGAPTMTAPVVLAVEMRSDRDGDAMSASRAAVFSNGAVVVGPLRLAPTSLPRAKWKDLVVPLAPMRLPLAFP